MNDLTFTTFAVAKEIDLNRIAVAVGIRKKFTWEEPLVIEGESLRKITSGGVPEERIYVFSFGSIVFVNSDRRHTEAILTYLKSLVPEIDIANYGVYQENYAVHLQAGQEIECTDMFVQVPEMLPFYPLLVSTVIAKSAALERIEEQLGRILDDLESKIDSLEKGRPNIGNRELARTTARIVRHEYNTIAYTMILDEPDITWTSSDASEFYGMMSEFFGLSDRYEVIRSKTEVLKSIIGGFSSISNSRRGLFVEWVIVVLIAVELLIMMIVDFFR